MQYLCNSRPYKIMSEASVTFSIKAILINFSFISRQTFLDIKLICRNPEPEINVLNLFHMHQFFFNNTCFPVQFLIVTSLSEPVTKNTCIYLQGFLCPRPVQRPPSFPLGEAWDYKERKIKNKFWAKVLAIKIKNSQFPIASYFFLPRNVLRVSQVMPLCVATFTSLLDSSKEHCHGRHIVQEFARLENYKVFTTFACMETVTDGKVKVKSSNCNGHVCNLGCRTFWEKQILKVNQISLCTILWGKISKPHLTEH